MTVTGWIDGAGRLVRADARLAALQRAAGGIEGGPLAVPALAALAASAAALGEPLTRAVIVAEGAHDLDLVVRAVPEAGGVTLGIDGWTQRPPRRPWLAVPPGEPVAEAAPAETLRWSVDGAMALNQCEGFAGARAFIGRPLTALFRLLPDAAGAMPLLTGLARNADFTGQPVVRYGDEAHELLLDGLALRDLEGRFAGYVGTGRPAAVEPAAASAPVAASAFVDRLEAALRAPLAKIASGADRIGAQTDGPLRRDYADYAGDIGSAARHLLALVDDLADLQAIERPGFVIAPEDIDLADIARRAAGLLQVRASDKGVRIDRPAEDEVLPARGDFRRVLQILVNLLGNAVRYSPDGAQIWLRAERDGDHAVLVVADQGKGIGRDDQARIFEKFERVDPSEAEGSGLGLYISRRLARAMGGDIAVDSAPGQGARFTLSLPAG